MASGPGAHARPLDGARRCVSERNASAPSHVGPTVLWILCPGMESRTLLRRSFGPFGRLSSAQRRDASLRATQRRVRITQLATGRVEVSVYVYWTQWPVQEMDNDWRSGTVNVPKVVHQLKLSTQQAEPDARASFQLGTFEKEPDGGWSLNYAYIPPLLLIGTTPYLGHELSMLKTALEAFQVRLSHDSVASLSVELTYGSRECLKSLLALKRMLKHMERGIHPHPYTLFETLVSFYVEVCLYRDSTPVAARSLYNHIHRRLISFRLGPLLEQMTVASQKTPYLEFERQDGLLSVTLPKDVRLRSAFSCWFRRRPQHSGKPRPPGSQRLHVWPLCMRALSGVTIQAIDQPSLGQSFGPEILFYQMTLNEEWNAAVAEGALNFYYHPNFGECSFYLVWK